MKKDTAEELKNYLNKHNLEKIINDMVNNVVQHPEENPKTMMVKEN